MTEPYRKFPNDRILKRLTDAIAKVDEMALDRQAGVRDVIRVLQETDGSFDVMKELSVTLNKMLEESQSSLQAGQGHLLEAIDNSQLQQFNYNLREMATVVMLEGAYFEGDPLAQAAAMEAGDADVVQQAFENLINNDEGPVVTKVVVAALRAMNTPKGRPALRQTMYNCPDGVRAFLQMYEAMALAGPVEAIDDNNT